MDLNYPEQGNNKVDTLCEMEIGLFVVYILLYCDYLYQNSCQTVNNRFICTLSVGNFW